MCPRPAPALKTRVGIQVDLAISIACVGSFIKGATKSCYLDLDCIRN